MIQDASARPSGRNFVAAMAWTGGAKWLVQIVSWPVTIVVARVLTPSDYGLFGIATLVITSVSLAMGLGIATTIVAQKVESGPALRQLGCLAVLSGLITFGLVLLSAGHIAGFFEAKPLAVALPVLGTTFILESMKAVPEAVLALERRFRLLATIEAGRALLTVMVTLVSAIAGFGYWALIAGHLTGAIAVTVATVLLRPIGLEWPRWKVVGPIMRVSSHVVGTHLAWYCYSYSDQLVIGRALGPAALGSYSMAAIVSNTPVEKLAAALHRVSPSFFAANRDDKAALKSQFLRMTEGVALLAMPACTGLALVADDFILTLLGAKWSDAALPLRMLCLYNIMRCLAGVLTPLLLVLGESRYVFLSTMAAALALPFCFLAGSQRGIGGVAAVWVLAYPLVALPLCVRLFSRIQLPVHEYVAALGLSFRPTVLMAFAVLALNRVTPPGWTPIERLISQVATGTVVAVGMLFILERRRVQSLLDVAILVVRGTPNPHLERGHDSGARPGLIQ